MSDRLRYITLVASLPHLGPPFSKAEVPISRFRLEQRLGMLAADHRRKLDRVIEITTWSGVSAIDDDAGVIRLARAVIADLEGHPDLQHLVGARMETRTLIAALRRRHRGQEAPGDVASWGFGRWTGRIAANWSDQAFGLGHFMPWIAEAGRALAAGDHVGVERVVLGQVFRQIDHYGAQHAFDFEAVVLYVLRWSIVDRWAAYGSERAAERLSALVAEVLSTAPALPGAPPPVTDKEIAR